MPILPKINESTFRRWWMKEWWLISTKIEKLQFQQLITLWKTPYDIKLILLAQRLITTAMRKTTILMNYQNKILRKERRLQSAIGFKDIKISNSMYGVHLKFSQEHSSSVNMNIDCKINWRACLRIEVNLVSIKSATYLTPPNRDQSLILPSQISLKCITIFQLSDRYPNTKQVMPEKTVNSYLNRNWNGSSEVL